MALKSVNNVLRLEFGKFNSDSAYFQKEYDITFYRDGLGLCNIWDSTFDSFVSFSQNRRADIDKMKLKPFKVFCKDLMEDLSRYINLQARRGGYPYNHHSTFNVKSLDGKLWGQIKLSSDPGYKSRFDPVNNEAHRGAFAGRPEEFKKLPY